MSIREMLAELAREAEDRPSRKGLPEAQAETLKERFAAIQFRHPFSPGDLVQFKPNMGFAPNGVEKDPWIVIDIDLAGYPQVRVDLGTKKQRYDIALGAIDSDGAFFIDLWDSRFFEPFSLKAEGIA